eukprot:Sspe_Gene.50017::Locus_27457_Transcript_1_1_Confidence_1.000_Length_703::g.50017::m.50017
MYQYPAIFVQNLPENYTSAEIDKIFGKYGRIMNKTLKPQFLFIDFEEQKSIQAILNEEKPFMLHGVRLKVTERKSPEQREKEKIAAKSAQPPRGMTRDGPRA